MNSQEWLSRRHSDELSRLTDARRGLLMQISDKTEIQPGEFENFSIGIIQSMPALDATTAENELLLKMGIVRDGMVHIPMLIVIPKDNKIPKSLDNLRIKLEGFEGDMEYTPKLSVGFMLSEQNNAEFKALDTFTLPPSKLQEQRFCMGLRWERYKDARDHGRNFGGQVFEVKLTENEDNLFYTSGDDLWLRDGIGLERVAQILARRVDLYNLSGPEWSRYEEIIAMLSQPSTSYDKLVHLFQLPDEGLVYFLLEDDINVSLFCAQGQGADESNLLITISGVQVFHDVESGEARILPHFVRPQKGDARGDVVIKISERGARSIWAERNGQISMSTKPADSFIHDDRLAVLLAKLVLDDPAYIV